MAVFPIQSEKGQGFYIRNLVCIRSNQKQPLRLHHSPLNVKGASLCLSAIATLTSKTAQGTNTRSLALYFLKQLQAICHNSTVLPSPLQIASNTARKITALDLCMPQSETKIVQLHFQLTLRNNPKKKLERSLPSLISHKKENSISPPRQEALTAHRETVREKISWTYFTNYIRPFPLQCLPNVLKDTQKSEREEVRTRGF